MTEERALAPRRRWFLFALRDQLPLGPDGWRVYLHAPECSTTDNPPGLACGQADVPCLATTAEFVPFEDVDDSMGVAVADMNRVVAALSNGGRATSDLQPPDVGMTTYRWVAAASTPIDDPDDRPASFSRAFVLLHDAVGALRVATGWAVPSLAIERVYPMYFVAETDGAGVLDPDSLQITLVEHGKFGPPPPAEPDALALAEQLLVGRWRRNPVEMYRDFAHAARSAAYQDGDYTKAVTSSAIAAEVLIKHTAWMLTFEARSIDPDPAPHARTTALGKCKPSQLLGDVLMRRLGGGWDSKDVGKPIGAWRQHVARMRTQLLHRGHRPTAPEADEAVHALGLLEAHIGDRLAVRAGQYPRTAVTMFGPRGLARRNALAVAEAALVTATEEDPDSWLASYVKFLDRELDQPDID